MYAVFCSLVHYLMEFFLTEYSLSHNDYQLYANMKLKNFH